MVTSLVTSSFSSPTVPTGIFAMPLYILTWLPARLARHGHGIVVARPRSNARRHAKIDERDGAVDPGAGMPAREQILDAHQSALHPQFEQRPLSAESSIGPRQRRIQFVLVPGGFHIHGVDGPERGHAGAPEPLAGQQFPVDELPLGRRQPGFGNESVLRAKSAGAEGENQ